MSRNDRVSMRQGRQGASLLCRGGWKTVVVGVLSIALLPACASNPKKLSKAIPQDHLAEISRPDIPLVMNDRVQDWLNYFQGPGRSSFQRFLARSGKYIPMMRKILKEHGMPENLVYLSMIESGFNPHAYSRARAMGAWQFIYQTGTRYGLKADSWIDERRDPEKSTVAAAKYLKDLYDRFNNWYLAAAGYNAGEGKIDRAIRKYETEDFWELARGKYLRAETKDYVPKLIAAALIAKNPSKYGFKEVAYEKAIAFETVTVNGPLDLRVAAKCAGVSYEDIKALNPELLHWVTPPDLKEYTLKVPSGAGGKFKQTYAGLNRAEMLGSEKVTAEDSIPVSKLARQHGLPPLLLAAANGISPGDTIKEGQKISIPMDPPEGEEYYDRDYLRKDRKGRHHGGRGSVLVYKVRSGDNAQKLARKMGMTVAELKASNPRVNWSRLRHGQKIKLYAAVSPDDRGSKRQARSSRKARSSVKAGRQKSASVAAAPSPGRKNAGVHKVKRGDTLSEIAKRYNVSTQELKQINGISNGKKLKAGKNIRIPTKQQASSAKTLPPAL